MGKRIACQHSQRTDRARTPGINGLFSVIPLHYVSVMPLVVISQYGARQADPIEASSPRATLVPRTIRMKKAALTRDNPPSLPTTVSSISQPSSLRTSAHQPKLPYWRSSSFRRFLQHPLAVNPLRMPWATLAAPRSLSIYSASKLNKLSCADCRPPCQLRVDHSVLLGFAATLATPLFSLLRIRFDSFLVHVPYEPTVRLSLGRRPSNLINFTLLLYPSTLYPPTCISISAAISIVYQYLIGINYSTYHYFGHVPCITRTDTYLTIVIKHLAPRAEPHDYDRSRILLHAP
ncbi:hypothetical protein BOTBODRAFT_521108 [Botryobasidium botryosum FD-172 SS1]|uniref:Uncharacterized protein n=1 Tax=Botryobasidium botryosum (strain FD-172 SS1) TaxID=930990 RepID=A0A067MCZ0_BOTB1|nr:hypothetical protein BOTBODRAFT_521108 [Botryobasidium botryosum FD-172 SS1]